jgi:spore maturation protein CgeB
MNNSSIRKKLEQINKTRKWLNQGQITKLETKAVEEIGNTGWYKQADVPITFDQTNTFYSELKNDKHAYFSYKEQNTKFSTNPSSNELNLQTGKTYNVTIKGQKDKEVTISLFAIFYKNGNRLEDQVVSFNNVKEITTPDDFDGVRLALKVVGAGMFKIDSIQIEDVSVWGQAPVEKGSFSRIDNSNWYLPNEKSVSFDSENSSFYIDLEKGKHIYIPYKEANINFSGTPHNPITLNENLNLQVLFEGEKDAPLDVKLFLIFYNSNNEKVDTQQVELNHKRLIKPDPDTKNIRLAIRAQGSGQLKISTVAISGEGFWHNNRVKSNISSFPKFDYSFTVDKTNLSGLYEDNKILVHVENDCFESKLSSQQYRYLPCFDASELNAPPKETVLVPKQKHYYEIHPTAALLGHVGLELFIYSYKNGKRINIKQVPFNQQSIISFHEDTTDVKFVLRVNGEGLFQNVRIHINEKEIEITNELTIELTKEDWYPSNKLINLSNQGNTLLVDSSAGEKRAYASYKEKNNSYAVPPISHLLSIKKDSVYEIVLNATVPEDVQFIPMVVEYIGEQKGEVYQFRINTENTFRFHPETTDLRLAFRISGTGKVQLEQFSIKEMMVLPDTDRTKFVSNREPYELNLVKPKPLKKLKMAVIFDVFTTASYAEECELITFTPDNWLETLTSNKPDLLMVESAWVGNNGSWNKLVGYYGEENMKPLFNLIKWCNENNIPTVFWNKEDPVHFNRFIKTAVKFDYIFTTDENMVPKYKELAGHEQVYALPFAAQPVIHNPIKIVEEREDKACFAGSYYRHHEDRSKDMDRVLDSAANYGLDIYDRNYEKNLKGLMPNHMFPDRFKDNIKGSLKYYEIDKAYKGYKVMINVNTVKDSPTMFSRRVFEGLASGTPVISTYAKGIEVMFGDLVNISENEQEIDHAFKVLLNDEKEYRRKSMLGIRDVLSKHTYTQRLNFICEVAGIPVSYQLPKVTVIALIHSKEEFFRVLDQFNNQNYEFKELYMLVDTFEGYLDLFRHYNTKNVKTFVRSYMHKYQNMLEWIDTPYITYFDQNDYYGSNYLLDLMLSTTFTDSEFIGKGAHFAYDAKNQSINEINSNAEYEFVTSLEPASTVVKTEVFSKESLTGVLENFEKGTDYSSYLKYGKKLYSNDKFNYVSNAYNKNEDEQMNIELVKQIQI